MNTNINKTNEIVTQLQQNKQLPVVNMCVYGLDEKPTNVPDLIISLEKLNSSIYNIEFTLEVKQFVTSQFKTPATKQLINQYANGLFISCRVDLMTEVEAKQPFKLVKIARNINAFDMAYEYIEEQPKWEFWSGLRKRIFKLIKSLKPNEISTLKQLTQPDKQKYFSIC